VAPGYRADFLLVDNLEAFSVRAVYLQGRDIAGHTFTPLGAATGIAAPFEIPDLSADDFRVPATGARIRAIEAVPGQILTREWVGAARVEHGAAIADPQRDLCKLAVVERHGRTGRMGLGFVRGLGIARGAAASSIAHDSHNAIVAGTSDRDMLLCLNRLRETGGGLVVAAAGRIVAELALPIAGLMSDASAEAVVRGLEAVERDQEVICPGTKNLFQALSFLALPVIPKLRLTDKGLVDVEEFDFVPLFVD
jgi:adenine deaminase